MAAIQILYTRRSSQINHRLTAQYQNYLQIITGGTVQWAESQRRSKHLLVRYHYICVLKARSNCEFKKTQRKWSRTSFTKPLGPMAFERFVELLGLTSVARRGSGVEGMNFLMGEGRTRNTRRVSGMSEWGC